MASIGFRIFCITIAVLFFFESAFSEVLIGDPMETDTSISYDDANRVTGVTDSTGTRTYFRAGVGSRSAVLSDGAATYTPGISERRSNISRFYTLNAQGSTTQLTGSSQEEAASFSYDAWGNRIGTRNSDDPPFLFGGGFGYETDPDTGLVWVGSFPYLPDIGRFIGRFNSSASTGGGYAPVGNNPNTSSSGPIAERVADIAEGGNNTTYVGFEPLDPCDPEYLPPVFAGFTGWAWGKDAQQIKSDLVNAGVAAVVNAPYTKMPVVLSLAFATWYVYDLYVDNEWVYSGHTKDLVRREKEWQRKYGKNAARLSEQSAHDVKFDARVAEQRRLDYAEEKGHKLWSKIRAVKKPSMPEI